MQTSNAGQVVSGDVPVGNLHDDEYGHFLGLVQERLSALKGPLFETSADGLWDAYLNAFPASDRQFHTCTACRRFIETYGGLVVIDDKGMTESAFWSADVVGAEGPAVAAMAKLVRRAKVTGPFLSKATTWGFPVTGPWRHLSAVPPKAMVYTERALTAGQAMAEKREDFKNLARALAEYAPPAIHQALALLKSDALYRSEKVLGPCQFLADLHAAIEVNPHRRDNMIWHAVAAAPAGFCHPRSSMIGTLLDDIVAGVPFEDASLKFRAKMHPLAYQRPQAPPSAGNIAAAEKLVEKLGIAPSLPRRFARLDEIETFWRPALPESTQKAAGGVFGHLRPKDAAAVPSMTAPPQTMTWAKFAASVLPGAKAIELFTPYTGNYTAILTAQDTDAPPILQWDSAERRNPFSTYVYNGGSPAAAWGLPSASWVPVTALANQPHQWRGGAYPNHAPGVVAILEGAKDTRTGQGNALFPETLKSELREVRSTIEAYSRSAVIGGVEEASACGMSIGRGGGANVRLRVTDQHGVKSEFHIDRFE